MSPQEIFEYKRKWMQKNPSYVEIHSDARRDAKAWLKIHLDSHEYSHIQYTDIYEDTVFFENSVNSANFALWYKKRSMSIRNGKY